MKIHFRLREPNSIWTYPMGDGRFHEALRAEGIEVVKSVDSALLVICDSKLETCGKPTIIFVQRDAAELPVDAQHHDHDPCVIGYLLPMRSDGNSLTVNNWGVFTTAKPVEFFTGMLLQWLPYISDVVRRNPMHNTVDVSFAGTVGYQHFATTLHRKRLMSQWGQLQDLRSMGMFYGGPGYKAGGNVKRYMSPAAHYNLCASSKVVVSPWGVCELSWRDYEAALGCAMMVKPRGPQIEASPTPWTEDNTVWCEPDFSDLRECVDEAIEKWDNDRGALRKHRSMLIQAASYDWYAHIFKNAIKCISLVSALDL